LHLAHRQCHRYETGARGIGAAAAMIGLPAGTRIWIAAGLTDMRSGFNGLVSKVQTALAEDPFSGHVFVFRGKRGDLIKVLWWTGDGLCLLAKRLERGRFVWPQATSGTVSLTQAQLSMLLEGIDWRRPERTQRPASAL
jgi:transposase